MLRPGTKIVSSDSAAPALGGWKGLRMNLATASVLGLVACFAVTVVVASLTARKEASLPKPIFTVEAPPPKDQSRLPQAVRTTIIPVERPSAPAPAELTETTLETVCVPEPPQLAALVDLPVRNAAYRKAAGTAPADSYKPEPRPRQQCRSRSYWSPYYQECRLR